MTPPSVTSITFDKPSYTPGAVITATVNYVPGKSDSVQSFTATATDSATGQNGQLQVSFTVSGAVSDATNVTLADSGNRTWQKVSDNGSAAIFTATA